MSTKNSGMRIRVEKELRDDFVRVCKAQNRAAADVLREFMQTCVDQYNGGQGDLLATLSHSGWKNRESTA